MLIILPVFFYRNDIWHDLKCLDILSDYFKMLARLDSLTQVFVFTNNKEVKRIAAPLNFQTHVIKISEKKNKNNCLPFGSVTALRYLNNKLNDPHNHILFLNFRNPLLTIDIINQAIHKFYKNSNLMLLSVKPAIDHPCQLNSYYTTTDAGMICLFDTPSDLQQFAFLGKTLCSENYQLRISKPFYFDWQSHGIIKITKQGLYYREFDGFSSTYLPIKSNVDLDSSRDLFPLIQYIDNKTARAVLLLNNEMVEKISNISNHKFHILGTSLSSDPNAFLLLDISDGRIYFYLSGFCDHGKHICQFQYSVYREDGLIRHLSTDFNGKYDQGIVPVEVEKEESFSFIYLIKCPVENGAYDECIPFPYQNKLWEYSSSTGQVFNKMTNMEIHGRQDFPEVLEPDSSFLIAEKQNLLSNIHENVQKNKLIPYTLAESESIIIESFLDLLKYRAIKKNDSN